MGGYHVLNRFEGGLSYSGFERIFMDLVGICYLLYTIGYILIYLGYFMRDP